jgi:uncharacterized protein with GYD domain
MAKMTIPSRIGRAPKDPLGAELQEGESYFYMARAAPAGMQTYIALCHLTAQAKRNRAESLESRATTWAEFQKKGLKITAYDTLGPYDVVMIIESPSEELALKFLGAAGASGNIETTTLRAFSDAEMERVRAA